MTVLLTLNSSKFLLTSGIVLLSFNSPKKEPSAPALTVKPASTSTQPFTLALASARLEGAASTVAVLFGACFDDDDDLDAVADADAIADLVVDADVDVDVDSASEATEVALDSASDADLVSTALELELLTPLALVWVETAAAVVMVFTCDSEADVDVTTPDTAEERVLTIESVVIVLEFKLELELVISLVDAIVLLVVKALVLLELLLLPEVRFVLSTAPASSERLSVAAVSMLRKTEAEIASSNALKPMLSCKRR